MNKFFRIISFVILSAVILTSFISCSGEEPPKEEEVIPAAKELLEAAVEVNRIFFWEGLPHVQPTDNELSGTDLEYIDLTEEYMYLSETDLMNKAKAVYSEQYCNDIYSVAFEGIKVTDENALYPMYIVEQGVMKINRKLSEEGLDERLPKIDTVKAVELKPKRVVVSVEFDRGGVTEKQNVTLVKEFDLWRLDTPTY